MKRSPALREVSRREFCAFTALGLVAACTSTGGAIQTGGLNGEGGDDDDAPVDASSVGPGSGSGSGSGTGSGSGSGSGSGGGATCTGTATDVGAPSSFALNTPKYVSASNMFIVRDSGGLYALTAKCPHQGVTIAAQSSSFHCPAHGADFTLTGAVIDGPTTKSLQHYGLCLLANGNVGLQSSTKVASTVRLTA